MLKIPMRFINEVTKRVGLITEACHAVPLIGSPLECYLNPLLRADFYIGRKALLFNEPKAFLDMMIDSEDVKDRLIAAEYPNCTNDQFSKLSLDKNKDVKKILAVNPNLPVETAYHLINQAPLELANSIRTSYELLIELSKKPNREIRMAVAENPNCSIDLSKSILFKCASAMHAEIRKRVVEHPLCDRDLLLLVDRQKIKPNRGSNFELLLAIANHKSCSSDRREEIYLELSLDQDKYIQEYGPGNYTVCDTVFELLAQANCPENLRYKWVKQIIQDRDDRYALEILINRHCPEELYTDLFKKLINSKCQDVVFKLGDDPSAFLQKYSLKGKSDAREIFVDVDSMILNDEQSDTPVLDINQITDIAVMRKLLHEGVGRKEDKQLLVKKISSEIVKKPPAFDLSCFNFLFAKSFREDKSNPVSFLNIPKSSDVKKLKKASVSNDWVVRATVGLSPSATNKIIQNLSKDPDETVRSMCTLYRS